MIGLLAGIRANVATLVSRLTSGRATNLDNLDAAISTRAPASTALSSATWTNARAQALDHTGIKRVQHLEHTVIGGYDGGSYVSTMTLGTAVDITRTFILPGMTQDTGNNLNVGWSYSYELQNSTQLDFTLYQIGTATPSGTSGVKFQVEIIEFN